MTLQAFASELDRLNRALDARDDVEAQAAIYAMDWVAPGSAERMARALLSGIPAFATTTRNH